MSIWIKTRLIRFYYEYGGGEDFKKKSVYSMYWLIKYLRYSYIYVNAYTIKQKFLLKKKQQTNIYVTCTRASSFFVYSTYYRIDITTEI